MAKASDERRSDVDLNEVLTYWQPRLGLAGWRIAIESADINVRGQCQVDHVYPSAKIQIASDTKSGDFAAFDDTEELVLHELLHVVNAAQRRLWRDSLKLVPKSHRSYVWTQFEQHDERFVELIARVLVAERRGKVEAV